MLKAQSARGQFQGVTSEGSLASRKGEEPEKGAAGVWGELLWDCLGWEEEDGKVGHSQDNQKGECPQVFGAARWVLKVYF